MKLFQNDYLFDQIKIYTVNQVESIKCTATSSQKVIIVFMINIEQQDQFQKLDNLYIRCLIYLKVNNKREFLHIQDMQQGCGLMLNSKIHQFQQIQLYKWFGVDNELEVYIRIWNCLRLKKTGLRKLKCRTPRNTTNSGYGVKILYCDTRQNFQTKSSYQFSINLTVTNIVQSAIIQINNNAGIVQVSIKSAQINNASTETLAFNIIGTNLVLQH
ncbi:unnamed protein product [Paramecium pentaurelia]|uniref:Uncharacterized protein n=1 Tax=Paramecium pentaurelia TaxID=43138 RepID=A0A8S1X2H1_9CILI|nr:unnamed protein product [Paramecium pentaurelia]